MEEIQARAGRPGSDIDYDRLVKRGRALQSQAMYEAAAGLIRWAVLRLKPRASFPRGERVTTAR